MTISTEHLVEVTIERDHFPSGFISCENCCNKLEVEAISDQLNRLELGENYQKSIIFDPAENFDFHAFKSHVRILTNVAGQNDWRTFQNWHFYCAQCVIFCEDCGDAEVDVDSVTIGGRYIVCQNCSNHYSSCDSCNELDATSNFYGVDDDYLYCADCAGNYTYWCEPCDMRHRDEYTCESHDEYSTGLHNYSFKPEPRFYGSDDQNLFFGFELEVESEGNSIIDAVNLVESAWGDFVYLKSDGSLEHGFEIVSHPFSFEHYRTINFEVLNHLRGLGFRSWDTQTCGFHLHISKRGFSSNGHIWRFSNLIIGNQKEWAKLAGRTSEQWSSYSKNRNKIGKVLTGKEHPERYVAVNLCNWSTVEVRIFRGSLNVRRIASHIEAIYAAVQYTRNLSFSEVASGALRFDRFADWVNEVGDFGNFNDLLTAKKLINKSAPAAELGE